MVNFLIGIIFIRIYAFVIFCEIMNIKDNLLEIEKEQKKMKTEGIKVNVECKGLSFMIILAKTSVYFSSS